MKPYYRSKGTYSDGRKRIVIEYMKDGQLKSMIMPKPEEMLDRLIRPEISEENLDRSDPYT